MFFYRFCNKPLYIVLQEMKQNFFVTCLSFKNFATVNSNEIRSKSYYKYKHSTSFFFCSCLTTGFVANRSNKHAHFLSLSYTKINTKKTTRPTCTRYIKTFIFHEHPVIYLNKSFFIR